MHLKIPLRIQILRWVLRRWLHRMPFDTEAISRIKEADGKGKVVIFMRKSNWIDYLVWESIAERASLNATPQIIGLTSNLVPNEISSNTLVFLEGNKVPHSGVVSSLLNDVKAGTNVYLFAVTILWSLRYRSVERSLLEILFRPRERARWYRRAMWLILGSGESKTLIPPAISLHDFAHESDEGVEVVARKVRLSMRYHLAREERAFLGPRLVPRARLLERALNDKGMRQVIEDEAVKRSVAKGIVHSEAEAMLDEIGADFRWSGIRFLEFVLSKIFPRVYDEFDIDQEGMEKARQASKTGPILLVPTHKSHMDYLLISYIFKQHNFVPPHIAAGINLSFFPMGFLFRRAGAFFLRRSFVGDKVYETALKSYMKILLRENYSIEFFIEGTRSRSGKVMPPKFGMLAMLLEAQSELKNTHCQVVPVTIDYESLFEESAMVKEAQGAEKKEEGVGRILSAQKKLGKKLGKVYVRFGDPVSLPELQEKYAADDFFEQARHVGYDILDDILNTVTVTTSAIVATGICVHHKRGIRRPTLLSRVALFREAILRHDVYCANDTTEKDIDRALALFSRNKVVNAVHIQDELVYTVDDNKRMALDYYKNNIVHFLVNTSFACLAFRLTNEDKFEDLWSAYEGLHQFFIEEFHRVFTPPKPEELRGELDWLASKNLIEEQDGGWHVKDHVSVMAFENITRNFLESAYIAVMSILEHEPGEAKDLKEWLSINNDMGELLYAKGDIWRAEARSKINLGNALNSFRHKGLLVAAPVDESSKKSKPKYRASDESVGQLEVVRDMLQKILVEVQLN